MKRHRLTESIREEAERLDRLEEEGALDELPFTRLRRYAKEPSQVYAIRLPVSRLEAVRWLADVRGEQPTALMREWILERLDQELDDPGTSALQLVASSERPRQRKRQPGASERSRAREGRARSARRFQPARVRLLLVAETPPRDLSRYFYFEEVKEHDALFRYVAREVLDVEPTRETKVELLTQLRDAGVFLIDLKADPLDDSPLSDYVPDLVRRCRQLGPSKIVLIKTTVYDEAYEALAGAGLPVVNERIPFPGSGRQVEFQKAFRRALKDFVRKSRPRTIGAGLKIGGSLRKPRTETAPASELSQPVTAVDKQNGRIRIPRAAKSLLPPTKADIEVLLRDTRISSSYDPRIGPDRERSGVLRVGKDVLDRLVHVGERLRITRGRGGVVRLS
jgi:hypothetical protein